MSEKHFNVKPARAACPRPSGGAESSKFKAEGGFALLEIIVAVTILLTIGGLATAVYTRSIVYKCETATMEKLVKLTKGFSRYYDLNGAYPASISELAAYTDANNVTKDAWDKTISYFYDVKVDGVEYPGAFISGGKDGALESSIDADNNLTLASTDLYGLVTPAMLDQTDRSVSSRKIDRANTALNIYLSTNPTPDSECQTGGSTVCIEILYSQGLVQGLDTYDNWGHNLVLNNVASAFYSVGPDGTGGTSDDIT